MGESRYTKLIQRIVDGVFESFVLDENKRVKVIDEAKATRTSDLVRKLVVEKSRDLWEEYEAAEGSLRRAVEEINFESLNAGPDSIGTQSSEMSIDDLRDMSGPGVQAMESVKSLRDALGVQDFDLGGIFNESLDHLDKVKDPSRPLTNEMMGEDGDDDHLDGDQDYEELEMSDIAPGDEPGSPGEPMGDEDYGDDHGDIGDEDHGDMGDMGDENGDENGDMGDENGDMGDENGDENGDMGDLTDFDFDLDGDGGAEDEDHDDDLGEMIGEFDDDDDDDHGDDHGDDHDDDDDVNGDEDDNDNGDEDEDKHEHEDEDEN